MFDIKIPEIIETKKHYTFGYVLAALLKLLPSIMLDRYRQGVKSYGQTNRCTSYIEAVYIKVLTSILLGS